MTAPQSPGAPRPRGLTVGLTCFSAGAPGSQRLAVTAPRGTPEMVSSRARTEGAGPRGHGALGTQTWPPPLPAAAHRTAAQEDSPDRPRAPQARLVPVRPPPGCMMGNVVRSARPPAARGAGLTGAGRSPVLKPKAPGGSRPHGPRPLRPSRLEVLPREGRRRRHGFPPLTVEGRCSFGGCTSVISGPGHTGREGCRRTSRWSQHPFSHVSMYQREALEQWFSTLHIE